MVLSLKDAVSLIASPEPAHLFGFWKTVHCLHWKCFIEVLRSKAWLSNIDGAKDYCLWLLSLHPVMKLPTVSCCLRVGKSCFIEIPYLT